MLFFQIKLRSAASFYDLDSEIVPKRRIIIDFFWY